MKKGALILCTAALACTMSFPAFAAQTKAEYKTESARIRQEIESTGNTIKSIQEENRAAADACTAVKKAQKEAGQIKGNKDMWKQVKELKSGLTGIRVSCVEASSQARVLKAQTILDAEEGKYDEALAKLNQALEQKKAALGYVEQISGIWDQIDQLVK